MFSFKKYLMKKNSAILGSEKKIKNWHMLIELTLGRQIDSLQGRNYLIMWTIAKENKLHLQK